MKKRNVLRELLNEDKPSVSMHVHSIWPGMVEVIGLAGTMNYIEFSGEYAPYDLMSLENFGRAVDLFPNMSSMMKIEQQPRTYLAVRAVGSGIQNLLFADIWTVEDAREAVTASRADTPKTGGRAGHWWQRASRAQPPPGGASAHPRRSCTKTCRRAPEPVSPARCPKT